MNFVMPDFYPAAAEIFLLAMACAILLIDLILPPAQRWLIALLTQATLVGCALISYIMLIDGQVVMTFSNMFVSDSLANLLKLLMDLTLIFMLVYNRGYLAVRGLEKTEYYLLVLFGALGMMVMISASHFVSLYLGLELLSLSLYALVALDRDSARSTEAAMKYFVLGALASGLLLYGMSMIYGATGTLEIGGVAQSIYQGAANKSVLLFGLVFLVAGLAFKLGVVPFHMWIPDVYHGAPTAVALFIGSAPKLAAFAMAMRLLVYGLFDLAEHWQAMLMIMAVLSIAIGNLAAIAQTNLKRMLAYSAISHMGFMVLGLLSGVVGGNIDPNRAIASYSASLYYIISYVIMTLGAFGMMLLLSRAGHEAEEIVDFKGLNQRSPWFAAMMAIVMFSMAGIPPFIGFWAKFLVLLAVIDAGQLWLAIVAILFSLIGAFYYLRIVKLMYFDAPADKTPIQASFDMRLLLSVNGLGVLVLGLFPQISMFLGTISLLRSL
ncbi:MAG: NADH-quinone oxidoreductase subunit NuoN [Sterolibacterium sp.]|jgi:NADH-quinone oxidoreductase subunit N|nr:NADH-quinone oxidoreductase subunit NuoN [Sterolibacterium sp.]